MDPALIDDDDLPASRKSVLPGEGFFLPEDLQDRERDAEAAAALEARETVIVSDSDADGLACVALLREYTDEAAMLPSGPYDLSASLERVARFGEPEIDLYVCDLVPDRLEEVLDPLEQLLEAGSDVTWFDHHQWEPEIEQGIRDLGVDLRLGESGEECTANVVVREVSYEFPEYLQELADVTRDHDLWIKEDPRSDDLADFAYWAEPEEFVATVQANGVEFTPDVEAFLAERRIEKDDLIARAVDRAQFVEIGPWTVGVTYGRCSQNEVAESLREQGADASVIVKPAGSASIRGSEGFERCHEVARQVNGGGHPKAAGCKPDIYADMLDYAHHWVTEGAVAKREILRAFESLEGSA